MSWCKAFVASLAVVVVVVAGFVGSIAALNLAVPVVESWYRGALGLEGSAEPAAALTVIGALAVAFGAVAFRGVFALAERAGADS